MLFRSINCGIGLLELKVKLGILLLSEGLNFVMVLLGHEVGHPHEKLQALIHGHLFPLLFGRQRGLDGLADQVRSGVIELGHPLTVIVRLQIYFQTLIFPEDLTVPFLH